MTKKPKYPSNLKRLRLTAGLTQAEIGKLWGVERGDVSRIESGDVSITDHKRRMLTDAYGWTASQLYGDEMPAKVPVLGYVGAGERVFPIDDLALADGFSEQDYHTINCEFVEPPPGGIYRDMVALKVKGDSMEPFLREGSIVYYNETRRGKCDEYLNSPVVACLKDGSVYIKILKRGFVYGKYSLQSTNSAKIMDDVELQWCAKVAFTKPI